MVKPERDAQQHLQPDRAVGSIREGQALGVYILRIMRRDDDIECAVLQRLDHRRCIEAVDETVIER